MLRALSRYIFDTLQTCVAGMTRQVILDAANEPRTLVDQACIELKQACSCLHFLQGGFAGIDASDAG